MKRIAITPHSTYPSAVAATKATLAMLPMSPVVNMEDQLDDQGRILGETSDPSFVKFACEQQGYAKAVEVVDVPMPAPESFAPVDGEACLGPDGRWHVHRQSDSVISRDEFMRRSRR